MLLALGCQDALGFKPPLSRFFQKLTDTLEKLVCATKSWSVPVFSKNDEEK
jgi:hypothetical protein